MSPPIIAFFNNKGGVGNTSLVYHLAWMYWDLGLSVIAADLDPQANLTAAFLSEERLVEIWEGEETPNTLFRSIKPLLRGMGDIASPPLEKIAEHLSLLVGDLDLSNLEDELSSQWAGCLEGKERAFRVISAFRRLLLEAAQQTQAQVILMDLGPNLGAINRAALMASDFVVIPLSLDLFSLQGLKNLGPTLSRWREEWQERLRKNPVVDFVLPPGHMTPAGYIILQPGVKADRPVRAFERWMFKIPSTYAEKVLGESPILSPVIETIADVQKDAHCLALLKHYQSLMPMAQEARKPIFFLKPADGAIGSHTAAVKKVYQDFQALAKQIAQRINLEIESVLD